jgi:hypothetical protein
MLIAVKYPVYILRYRDMFVDCASLIRYVLGKALHCVQCRNTIARATRLGKRSLDIKRSNTKHY